MIQRSEADNVCLTSFWADLSRDSSKDSYRPAFEQVLTGEGAALDGRRSGSRRQQRERWEDLLKSDTLRFTRLIPMYTISTLFHILEPLSKSSGLTLRRRMTVLDLIDANRRG